MGIADSRDIFEHGTLGSTFKNISSLSNALQWSDPIVVAFGLK